LIGVDGERRVLVPEALAHHLDGYAGFDEKSSVGVADIVKANLGTPAGDDPLDACEREWGWIGQS
jgi:hypothetical protein